MQAYAEAFQPSDAVALIVHSSYGDHFWEQELQDSMHNSSQPAVLFFQVGPCVLRSQHCRAACCRQKVQSALAESACHRLAQIFQGSLHAMSPDVHVQEALSHAEMLRLYRSADVYVSPYRSEGFGLGTLEALTLGLQVCGCWLSQCMHWPSDKRNPLGAMHMRTREAFKRGVLTVVVSWHTRCCMSSSA